MRDKKQLFSKNINGMDQIQFTFLGKGRLLIPMGKFRHKKKKKDLVGKRKRLLHRSIHNIHFTIVTKNVIKHILILRDSLFTLTRSWKQTRGN